MQAYLDGNLYNSQASVIYITRVYIMMILYEMDEPSVDNKRHQVLRNSMYDLTEDGINYE